MSVKIHIDGEMPEINCKWPQMLITGKSVKDTDAIIDILISTDIFLTTAYPYYGGNNQKFNQEYLAKSGLQIIIDLSKKLRSDKVNFEISDHNTEDTYYSLDEYFDSYINKELNVLNNEYVSNSWASCSFIYGAHGFMNPNGIILYADNIGKWPDTSDLIQEFSRLYSYYPFLELNATIFEGESCESEIEKKPNFNISLKNNIVNVTKPDLSVHDHAIEFGMIDKNYELLNRSYESRNENGIPLEMISKIQIKVRKVVLDCLNSITDTTVRKYITEYYDENSIHQ